MWQFLSGVQEIILYTNLNDNSRLWLSPVIGRLAFVCLSVRFFKTLYFHVNTELFSLRFGKSYKFSSRRPKGHDIPLMRANFRLAKGELA